MNKNLLKKKRKNTAGFTLVELLVSIGLFSVVVLVAMGAIMTVVDSNRKSQTLTQVMNNMNFAFDSMQRTIKTGKDVSINPSGTSITVTDQEENVVTYSFDSGNQTIMKSVVGGLSAPIISDDVKIEDFQIVGFNHTQGKNYQPRVVLKIKGYAELTKKVRSDFNIQTGISLINLNI